MGEAMLKNVMGAVLLAVVFAVVGSGSTASAGAQNNSVSSCRETEVKVNEVPLPRKYQLVVPWENMSGIWFNDTKEESNRFVLNIDVVKKVNGKRFFDVEMINPENGEVLRRGVVWVKDNQRASGIMAEVNEERSARKNNDNLVIFRSFKEVDKTTGRPTNRPMFVVTIRTLEKVRVCEETHHELLRPNIQHD
jgi:hypothetical protein